MLQSILAINVMLLNLVVCLQGRGKYVNVGSVVLPESSHCGCTRRGKINVQVCHLFPFYPLLVPKLKYIILALIPFTFSSREFHLVNEQFLHHLEHFLLSLHHLNSDIYFLRLA